MNDEGTIGRRLLDSFFGPLTTEGITVFAVALGLPALSITPLGSLAFFFALLLLALLLVSRLASTWSLRGLTFERTAPERASVDRPFRVTLSVTNRHRARVLGPIRVDESIVGSRAAQNSAIVSVIGGRERVVAQYRLTIRRRGDHEFAPTLLTSSYPLGLHRMRRRTAVPSRILVRPRLGTLMPFFFEEVERHQKRVLRTRKSRTEEDFRGLREYRHGDNPRWIHWKRSARLQKIYVKEFEQPQSRRYLILLETCPATTDRRDRKPIEDAISFVATLLRECVRRGHRATLAYAGPEPTVIRMAPHPSQYEEVMDALARIESAVEPTLQGLLGQVPPDAIREALVVRLTPSGTQDADVRSNARLQGATAIWNLEVPSPAFTRSFRLTPRWPYAAVQSSLPGDDEDA